MGKKRKHQRRHKTSAAGFQPSANPELAAWMHQLRSSSAAQRHTPKPRKGTRRQREHQAIRDQRREEG